MYDINQIDNTHHAVKTNRKHFKVEWSKNLTEQAHKCKDDSGQLHLASELINKQKI